MARIEIASLPWGWVADQYGNGLPSVSVTIKNLDGTDATHYSALTGGTSTTGAISTNSDGTIPRFIGGGTYNMTVLGVTRQVEALSGATGAIGRVNLCRNPRGANTALWTPAAVALTDFTVTASPPTLTGLPTGVGGAFRLIGNASGDRCATLFPVVNGKVYRLSVYVYLAAATGGCGIAHQVLRGAGAGTQVYLSSSTTTTGQWIRLNQSITADATEDWEFRVRQSGAGTIDFYWTAVLLEQSATLNTYGDGYTAGWTWTGGPNRSTSEELVADLPSGRLEVMDDRIADRALASESIRLATAGGPPGGVGSDDIVNTGRLAITENGWDPFTHPIVGLTDAENTLFTVGGYYDLDDNAPYHTLSAQFNMIVNTGTEPVSGGGHRLRCNQGGGGGASILGFGNNITVHAWEVAVGAKESIATATATGTALTAITATEEGSRFEVGMALDATDASYAAGTTITAVVGRPGAPTSITTNNAPSSNGAKTIRAQPSGTIETLGHLVTGSYGSTRGESNLNGTAYAVQAGTNSAFKQGVNIQTGALLARGAGGGIGGTAYRAFALSANRAFASESNDLNDGFICDGTSTYVNAAFRIGPLVSAPDGMIIDGTYTDAALLIRANAPIKLGTAVGTGNFLEYWEQTSDPANPATNALRMFTKDVAGKTLLAARQSAGTTELHPGWFQGSKTFDFPSVADGAMTSTTVTVTGAAVGDLVAAGHSTAVPAGALLVGAVTAADTVTVTLFNKTGGALDLASGTLRAAAAKLI